MSKRRISVRGIIVKDGKILAQRPKNSKTNVPYDFWCTMGGGMDAGESIEDCLKREMIEETGIVPEVGRLLYVQQFHPDDDDKEILDFFFEIKNIDDYEHIDLAKTTHGEIETAEYGFVDPNSVDLLPEFLRTRNIANDIDEHAGVVFFNYLGQK